MEEYNDPLRKFKETMEEDQKPEERLKTERMAETKQMAEEMSEAAMRRVEESKNKWPGRWEHSVYLCADRIQER